ncbi:major facilitator superfamily domain-containing protein [Phascolomyces articulosus]|uniref:Major facilitator superfamily domain-containing protein n=1 Tax=Phascolomyces articulosus TaxID=60185 RepID=A0AAD5PGM0_9FUNG|nr:major facilitator superfamily domain-containing protein [Phascolomyces articulosus]
MTYDYHSQVSSIYLGKDIERLPLLDNFIKNKKFSYHKGDLEPYDRVYEFHDQHSLYNTTEENHDLTEEPLSLSRRKWLVLAAAFLAGIEFNGISYCWGVFQDYYQREMFGNDDETKLKLTFIGTTISFMSLTMFSPTEYIVSKIHFRGALLFVIALVFCGFAAAPFCTQIWQLYISLVICTGTGFGILFSVCIFSIAQWFSDQEINTAYGILFASTGVAGSTIPFLVTWISEHWSMQCAYHSLNSICLLFNIIALIIIREKPHHQVMDHQETQTRSLKEYESEEEVIAEIITVKHFHSHEDTNIESLSNRSLLRKVYLLVLNNPSILTWLIIGFLRSTVDISPFTFLPSYATFIGLSPMQGAITIALMSITSTIGPICTGFIADFWLEKVDTLIIFTAGFSVSALGWVFSYNYNALLLSAALMGFCSPSYFTLAIPVLGDITDPNVFSFSISVAYFVNAVGIIAGPFAANAIESIFSIEPFMTHKLGCFFIPGLTIIFIFLFKMKLK